MIHTPRRKVAAAALTTAALAVPLALPALADSPSDRYRIEPLSEKYALPTQFAVGDGKIWVTDAAQNTLTKLGRTAPLGYGIKGGDTSGVAVKRDGKSIAWSTTSGDQKRSHLIIQRKGKGTVVANVGRHERKRNPDAVNTYGFAEPGADCTKEWSGLKDARPISYKGIVETHAYAVAAAPHGGWYVADAAANAVLEVDHRGKVSTLAVLPPQPAPLTAAAATELGLKADSACVGKVYNWEPVPTDVEVGPRGTLYVSLLPGGPETTQAGARGSVYKVYPRSGTVREFVTGFAGATNLAVTPHGTVYVAEFFAGRISKISKGKIYPAVEIPGVLAIEHANDHLYAATAGNEETKDPGKVLKLHYRH